MSNPEPEKKTEVLIQVFSKLGIPALFNTAGGGLKEPEVYDRNQFHFVNSIPYDWILPKAYACIHHGGSGTTHLGVKYGCATTIIPHIIDQYFWNNVLSEQGLGPKGISIAKMNSMNLESIVQSLWYNSEFKSKAEELSVELKSEDFEDEILNVLIN